MKAIIFRRHSPSLDVLEVVDDMPVPAIGPDDVLVQVRMAALNRLDDFVRRGWKGLNLEMPHILGSDMVGTIVQVGKDVTDWKVGQRVTANPGVWCGKCEFCQRGEHSLCLSFHILGEHVHGTYAEFVKVPARNLIAVPDHVPDEVAAAAPLVFLTAWRMLITRAKLRAGESVLVVGSGGGVNSAAIQIAKFAGATVYALAGNQAKAEKALSLGADIVYNYHDASWSKQLYTATGRRGVDVVVDNVGEATFPLSLRALVKGGRLVTVGATTGPKSNANIGVIFSKQISIIGSTMGNQNEFIQVMSLIWAGKLHPLIDRTYPIEAYREALQRMLNDAQIGKILLQVAPSSEWAK